MAGNPNWFDAGSVTSQQFGGRGTDQLTVSSISYPILGGSSGQTNVGGRATPLAGGVQSNVEQAPPEVSKAPDQYVKPNPPQVIVQMGVGLPPMVLPNQSNLNQPLPQTRTDLPRPNLQTYKEPEPVKPPSEIRAYTPIYDENGKEIERRYDTSPISYLNDIISPRQKVQEAPKLTFGESASKTLEEKAIPKLSALATVFQPSPLGQKLFDVGVIGTIKTGNALVLGTATSLERGYSLGGLFGAGKEVGKDILVGTGVTAIKGLTFITNDIYSITKHPFNPLKQLVENPIERVEFGRDLLATTALIRTVEKATPVKVSFASTEQFGYKGIVLKYGFEKYPIPSYTALKETGVPFRTGEKVVPLLGFVKQDIVPRIGTPTQLLPKSIERPLTPVGSKIFSTSIEGVYPPLETKALKAAVESGKGLQYYNIPATLEAFEKSRPKTFTQEEYATILRVSYAEAKTNPIAIFGSTAQKTVLGEQVRLNKDIDIKAGDVLGYTSRLFEELKTTSPNANFRLERGGSLISKEVLTDSGELKYVHAVDVHPFESESAYGKSNPYIAFGFKEQPPQIMFDKFGIQKIGEQYVRKVNAVLEPSDGEFKVKEHRVKDVGDVKDVGTGLLERGTTPMRLGFLSKPYTSKVFGQFKEYLEIKYGKTPSPAKELLFSSYPDASAPNAKVSPFTLKTSEAYPEYKLEYGNKAFKIKGDYLTTNYEQSSYFEKTYTELNGKYPSSDYAKNNYDAGFNYPVTKGYPSKLPDFNYNQPDVPDYQPLPPVSPNYQPTNFKPSDNFGYPGGQPSGNGYSFGGGNNYPKGGYGGGIEIPPSTPKQFIRDSKLFSFKGEKAFAVFVRRKGKFLELETPKPLTRGEALVKGLQAVGTSAAATFKIRPTGKLASANPSQQTIRRLPSDYLYQPKTIKPMQAGEEIFTERSKYRIKSRGELEEITFKGIAARRKNKTFGVF